MSMIPILLRGSWNSTQPSTFVGMSAFSAARTPCSCFLISGAAIVSQAREGSSSLRSLCGSPPFFVGIKQVRPRCWRGHELPGNHLARGRQCSWGRSS